MGLASKVSALFWAPLGYSTTKLAGVREYHLRDTVI